jgi:hypothetical protein
MRGSDIASVDVCMYDFTTHAHAQTHRHVQQKCMCISVCVCVYTYIHTHIYIGSMVLYRNIFRDMTRVRNESCIYNMNAATTKKKLRSCKFNLLVISM